VQFNREIDISEFLSDYFKKVDEN